MFIINNKLVQKSTEQLYSAPVRTMDDLIMTSKAMVRFLYQPDSKFLASIIIFIDFQSFILHSSFVSLQIASANSLNID